MLDDTDPEVRAAVLEALERYGEAVLPHLKAAAHTCRPAGRELALRALASLNKPEAWEVIRRGLRDADPGVRIAAAHAMAAGGDEEHWGAAASALWDFNPSVRKDVTPALIETFAKRQVLAAVLREQTREVKDRAAWALVEHVGEPGVPDLLRGLVPLETLVPHLLRQVQSDHAATGEAAAELLGELSELPYAQLAERLDHESGEVRERLIRLLGGGGERVAHFMVKRILLKGHHLVRKGAMDVLVQIGEPSVGPLVDLVRRQWGGVRSSGVEALGRIGHPAAVRVLVRLLEEGTACMEAADALREIARRSTAPPELRAAIPVLKRRLSPWAFSSPEETTAYQAALNAIEAATPPDEVPAAAGGWRTAEGRRAANPGAPGRWRRVR